MGESVHLENVSKVYQQGDNKVVAVTGVDLTIRDGEFISLVGPSGSGKSTLLNLIGGLDQPTSGKITVAGRDLTSMTNTELSELRLHKIGFVFQAYNLIPVLTARENVEFVMELQGVEIAQRTARASQVLEAVGLKGLEDRRPAQLSGGQQQRVAVGRAIASNPRLILADEPTANLDSTNAKNLVALMRRMNEEDGITFVFSTHDPIVMAGAKRIVKLKDGRIDEDHVQS